MATMDPTRAGMAPIPSPTTPAARTDAPGPELAQRLEGYIEQRSCGRIRDLHVVCNDGVIILQGRTRTYHAKQLAQEAALDLADDSVVLANQIIVS
jgi:hypothetical protein